MTTEEIIKKHFVGVISVEENESMIRVVTKNVCARLSDMNGICRDMKLKDIEVCTPHDADKFGLIYEIIK